MYTLSVEILKVNLDKFWNVEHMQFFFMELSHALTPALPFWIRAWPFHQAYERSKISYYEVLENFTCQSEMIRKF